MTDFIDDNSKMFIVSVGGIMPEEVPISEFSGTTEGDSLNIDAGAIPAEPAAEPLPPYDVLLPTAEIRLPVDDLSPWDQEIKADNITGAFDSWVGEVTAVHYAAADPLLGYVQAVEVKRVSPTWLGNNTPSGFEIPQAHSQPTVTRAVALPWPPRHDQQLYHVAVGNLVAVISGRDGRHYFFNDELPFVAQVVKADGDAATEANTGGAGLTTLTVRRQAMSGDPDDVNFAGATLIGLADPLGAEIRYSDVLVIKSPTSHHGYRVGDYVWVQRRGRYYFVIPARETFTAFLVNAGPEAEADFTTNKYWVREYKNAVSYTGNNAYSLTPAVMTQTDPTGSGGRAGRWVQATNIGEPATLHELYCEPANDVANAEKVVVSMYADAADGEPWYSFNRPMRYKGDATWIGAAPGGVKQAAFEADLYDKMVEHLDWNSGSLTDVTGLIGIAAAGGAVSLAASAGTNYIQLSGFKDQYDAKKHSKITTDTPTNPYINFTLADTKIGTLVGGATVAPCDKITFVGATVAQDGAVENNDATVTISAATLTGISLFVDKWIRVTGGGTAQIDSRDWRGRIIWSSCHMISGVAGPTIANATVGSGGTGYLVNDVLTVVQGGASGGTVTVSSIGGAGDVTAISVTTGGTGYALANGLATTGGSGTGATVNVTLLGGANAVKWGSNAVGGNRFGPSFVTDGSAEVLATGSGAGGGSWTFYISSTGTLELSVTGYVSEYQIHVWAKATVSKSTADTTL